MTTFAKTLRVSIAVGLLALTTAGAASADVFKPNPYLSRGAFTPNPYQSRDYYHPGSDVWSHLTRFHLTIGGCTRGCVI